jgi:lysylphosphatidylglycerol synthetase-like protein (DUF2156 family)
MDYKKDSHKSSFVVKMVVMVVGFALIIAATILQQHYATSWIMSAMIALMTTAAFYGMQLALSNAGYLDAAMMAGAMMKVYGYSSFVVGGIAQATSALNVLKQIAMKALEKYLLPQLVDAIGSQYGAETAAIMSSIMSSTINIGVSGSSVGTGIIAGLNQGTADYNRVQDQDLVDSYNLSDEDQETLEEIEKAEKEAMFATNTATYLQYDKNAFYDYTFLDPVDATEKPYIRLDKHVDGKVSPYYRGYMI